jgi:hypothetical protein
MKYCSGRCRNKNLKNNNLQKCPYLSTYTIDKESKNDKLYEICSKRSYIIDLIWKLFFPDLIDLNNYKVGKRESNMVSFNRESFLEDRKL